MENSNNLRIKKVRKMKNLTQEQIAEKLGITAKTYAGYEKGTTESIPTRILIKLSDTLGVSIDYLLGKDVYLHVENKGISEITGLSDKAIEKLRKIVRTDEFFKKSNETNNKRIQEKSKNEVSPLITSLKIPIINFVIESDIFEKLVNDFSFFLRSDLYKNVVDDSFHQLKNSHGLPTKCLHPADNDFISDNTTIPIDQDFNKALAKNLLDLHLHDLCRKYKIKKLF